MTPEANAVLSAAEAVVVSNQHGWSYKLESRLGRLHSAVVDYRVASRKPLPAARLAAHAVTPPTIALAASAIRELHRHRRG